MIKLKYDRLATIAHELQSQLTYESKTLTQRNKDSRLRSKINNVLKEQCTNYRTVIQSECITQLLYGTKNTQEVGPHWNFTYHFTNILTKRFDFCKYLV